MASRTHIVASLALFLVALITGASAAEFPAKSIRLVVAYPEGSPATNLARVVSATVEDVVGKSVIVDCKPGANGTIAAQTVAAAPPDGYTLLLGNSLLIAAAAINP